LQFACGSVLIIALGLAWLVENQQRIRLRVELEAYEQAGPLLVRRPRGWSSQHLGDTIAFDEPSARAPGRHVEISRRYCPVFLAPLEYLLRSEELSASELSLLASAKTAPRVVRICGWPGVLLSQVQSIQQVMVRRSVLAAVVLPSAEAVVIRLSGGADAADEDLVARLAESIALDGAALPRASRDLEIGEDIGLSISTGFMLAGPADRLRTERRLLR